MANRPSTNGLHICQPWSSWWRWTLSKEKKATNSLDEIRMEIELFLISSMNTRKRIETAVYYGANEPIEWRSFVKFPVFGSKPTLFVWEKSSEDIHAEKYIKYTQISWKTYTYCLFQFNIISKKYCLEKKIIRGSFIDSRTKKNIIWRELPKYNWE